MNFWQTKEWIEAKTTILKTEKLLNRTEYLRLVGSKNYSEEKYQKYLAVMSIPDNCQNVSNIEYFEGLTFEKNN